MNKRLTGLLVLAGVFALMVFLLLTQETAQDPAGTPTTAASALPTPVEDLSGLRGDDLPTAAPTEGANPTAGAAPPTDDPREIGTPVTPASPDELPAIFPDVAAQDIAAIRLQDPLNDRQFTLARDTSTGNWYAPEFEDRPLQQDTARGVAITLDILPYLRTCGVEDRSSLTQYGFREEGSLLFVQFVTVLGEEHFVAVGDPVSEPVNGVPAFYAMVDDRPEMYLVRQDSIFYLADVLQNPPLVEQER